MAELVSDETARNSEDHGSLIVQRFRKCEREIVQYSDYEQLLPSLVEKGFPHCRESEWEELLVSIPKGGEDHCLRFLDCLQTSDASAHLGHEYLAAILKEDPIAETQYCSDSIPRRVQANMIKLVDGLNLETLCPSLMEKGVLTRGNIEGLNGVNTTRRRNLKLIEILDSKGPKGYYFFLETLGEETDHRFHSEAYELLQRKRSLEYSDSECDSIRLPKRILPQRQEMHGPLVGKCYKNTIKRMHMNMFSGEWKKFEQDFQQCQQSPYAEIQIVGIQEKAMVCIFRGEYGQALILVREAKTRCSRVEGANQIFLRGRCENIKSTLYRKQGKLDKARTHVEKAERCLDKAMYGEDVAMAKYLHASVKAQRHGKKEKIAALYREAIAISRSEYCKDSSAAKLLQSHGPLMLAQVHLGSTHVTAGTCSDQDSIHEAEICLQQVLEVTKLPLQYQAQYYICQSDLQSCRGDADVALRYCKDGLQIARDNGFANEVKIAESRLQSLQLTL